jgi:hypothetical protein
MATATRTTTIGVFHDPYRAHDAIRALRSAGFSENQISVLGHDAEGRGLTKKESKKGEQAGAGAAVGAAAGAGVAALVSLGMTFGVIPVIGPVLAMGPLAAALLSAAGGAAAGGVAGALVGMGIPEDEAKYYEGEIKSGRILVTVHTDDRQDEAWAILQSHGAYNHGSNEAARFANR